MGKRRTGRGSRAGTASPRFALRPMALVLAAVFAPTGSALALPNGEQIVAGSVQIARPSAQSLVVQQGSAKAIVNWQGFSIGAPESVTFRQPGASSVILNRVVSNRPSEIFGSMTANGQVFLINPNGVLFGRGASVNVGGLVASTLNIDDHDFIAGRYRFRSEGLSGTVVNAGTLRASDEGTIALLGGQVSNEGTIEARLGTAALAAGGRVTIDFAGDGLTQVSVDEKAIGAEVRNSGVVIADGGQALMTARAAGDLVRTVVNQSGVVRANSVVARDGRIFLDGGDNGRTALDGTLDVSGPSAGVRGGEARVLGAEVALGDSARIDASGSAGGGSVLAGGDTQGRNPAISNAQTTTMAAGASITADALDAGPGGKVVLWSDGTTRVQGAIGASGGPAGGDGGFVETSGKTLALDGARVQAGSPRGRPGQWLIDPVDVYIDSYAAAPIAASLATTDVTVTTTPIRQDPGEPGDITVAADIVKREGPGTTKLSLLADRNIRIEDGYAIGSSAGPLHVDLIARHAANDTVTPGKVTIGPGASVITNGGDLLISGGASPGDAVTGGALGAIAGFGTEEGVTLAQATLDTIGPGGAAGSVVIRGRGGSVDFNGTRSGATGVMLDRAAIYGGAITIDGTGGRGDQDSGGDGITLFGSLVQGGDLVTLRGTGGDAVGGSYPYGGHGVWVTSPFGISSSVEGSGVAIAGIGGAAIGADSGYGGAGVSMYGADIVAHTSALAIAGTGGSGSNTLSGEGYGGAGISIDASTLSGNTVGLTGTGGTGSSGSTGTGGDGIALLITSVSGNDVDLDGTGGLGSAAPGSGVGYGGYGVLIQASDLSAKLNHVNVTGQGGAGSNAVNGTGGDGVLVTTENCFDGCGDEPATISGPAVRLDGFGGIGSTGSGAGDQRGGVGLRVQGSAWSDPTRVELSADGVLLLQGRGGLGRGDWTTGPGGQGGRGAIITDASLSSGGRLGIRGDAGNGADGLTVNSSDSPTTITSIDSAALRGQGQWNLSATGDQPGDGLGAAAGIVLGSSSGAPSVSVVGSNGTVEIAGLGDSGPGVELRANAGVESTGAATINVRGTSAQSSGLIAQAGATIGSPGTSANIVLAGDGGQDQDAIVLGSGGSSASVQTSGVIQLLLGGTQPLPAGVVGATNGINKFESGASGGTDIGGALRSGAPFNLSSDDLQAIEPGASTVVIGHTSYDAAITVRMPIELDGNLTLSQATSGSASIALEQPVTTTSGTLALFAAGALTQSPNAPISANNLVVRSGAGGVSLVAAGNSVRRLSMQIDGGNAAFLDSGALTLGSVSATSGNGFGTLFPVSTVANTFAQGDLLVRNAGGNLILQQNVSTGGSEITLVTDGVFVNSGNGALVPGGGDRWTVWASTWVGENRGGLVPSSPIPNVYGCNFPGSPSCASGVSVPATGNHFVYALQPTLGFSTNEITREYGEPNPTLSPGAVTGLQTGLGDSLEDALTVSVPFGPTTPVGTYSPAGTFSSPAGYLLAPTGVSQFTITPATLTYSAQPASREYGLPNPSFNGTVTGFRNNETLATATSGTLDFTSPAATGSDVGAYRIDGGGLSANLGNYVFVQAPGNASAFSITPAMLTYLADPVSREYGLPNPPLAGTLTGFRNGDSLGSATIGTLAFSTPATEVTNTGSHPITGSGLSAVAGNYAFAQAPGNATALSITPATLTYEASPVVQVFGAPPPPIDGVVTGFRVSDSQASATTGTLAFTTLATPTSPPGSYAVEGGGLSAVNYVFRQSPQNTGAFVLLPPPVSVIPVIGGTRSPETEPSYVYDRNFGPVGMCLPGASLTSPTGQAATPDLLELEWSRLRQRPNLSNCVSVGNRDYCRDF